MTDVQKRELAEEVLALANKYQCMVSVQLSSVPCEFIMDVEAYAGQEVDDVLETMAE